MLPVFRPVRWTRCRQATLLLLCLLASACRDAPSDAPAAFEPREYARQTLRPSAEAGPSDLANPFLAPGSAFEVIELEVPALPCVRTDSDDYLHIPEVTTSPGAPAVLWIVPPRDATQPVLIAFHGNGLDFIEAEASLLGHTDPALAEALLRSNPDLAGYVEIDNRNGALRGLRGEMSNATTAEVLERGWGVVVPGNCWGDGGHGEGEIVDYYIRAPRHGQTMDRGAWQWFRDTYPHDASREYSFGCSGGGQRTAQLLLHAPDATAASAIDSPADYLPAFRDDPPALFSLLAGIPEYPAVLDAFYVGHYGSIEAAGEQSLGTQLLPRGIATPIYFAYSVADTFATAGITAPLAAALSARTPADRAVVWDTGEPVHCQINTRERARDALDWLARLHRGEND